MCTLPHLLFEDIMTELCAAIEAGGTKWICSVGKGSGEIIEERVIPTTLPEETLGLVITALEELQETYGKVSSLGIGSFGPIMLNKKSPDYGKFLTTPKEGWAGFDLISCLKEAFGEELIIHLDTDVNTAVKAEVEQGAAKGLDNVCYVTVGTGIGAGIMVDGEIIRGKMHTEVGHILVRESPLEPNPPFSVCPFHADCLEGKASGSAMRARWGEDPLAFPPVAWELEADYLAQLAVTLTATYSPDVIVFGGGVIKYKPLISLVRKRFEELAGGYWSVPPMEQYIQDTKLCDRAGMIGSLILAGKKVANLAQA